MQHFDFKNELIMRHFVQLRESHNLIFQFATQAENKDKEFIIAPNARAMMRWPSDIENMYDYRKMWGVNYNRLMQLCIITLCSELEFMFKSIFTKYCYPISGNNKGFYQRFSDVVIALTKSGIDFSSILTSVATIDKAFQIRHICIHNMGIADQTFIDKTGLGIVGQDYIFTQNEYVEMVVAGFIFQKFLDDNLP